MAAGVTSTSQIDQIQAKIIAAVRYTQVQGTPMAGLMNTTAGRAGMADTLNNPKFGSLTAYGATEGTALAQAQQLSDTNVTVSASEIVVDVILTDKLVRTSSLDLYRSAGRIMGDAMNKKLDQDLLSLLDGLDTSLGSAGTTAAVGYYLAAVARLQSQSEPAPPPFYHVIHGFQFRTIADDLLALSSAAFGTQTPVPNVAQAVFENYTMARMFGVPIVVDNNISVDSSDDAKGGTFSRDAFKFYDWMPLTVKRQDDIGMRGTRLMLVRDYGYGELVGTFGFEQYFDASTPTS